MSMPMPKATAEPFTYLDFYRATASERIDLIRSGLDAGAAKRVIADLAFPQSEALAALRLSAATLNRKASRHEALPPDESERVIGVARLIGQLQAMMEEAGTLDGFDAKAWMSRWLAAPLPALGGRKPIEFLDTMAGQSIIADTLAQIQGGVYA